jgi:Domain of unknown function (DUF397)
MHGLDLTGTKWRKSSYSGGNGACVEVADLPEGIAVRDSKDPAGPKLIFTPGDWQAFVSAVVKGHAGLWKAACARHQRQPASSLPASALRPSTWPWLLRPAPSPKRRRVATAGRMDAWGFRPGESAVTASVFARCCLPTLPSAHAQVYRDQPEH